MKKRVISILLVGVLTAFVFQQAAMDLPSTASAMGRTESGGPSYAGEQSQPILLENLESSLGL